MFAKKWSLRVYIAYTIAPIIQNIHHILVWLKCCFQHIIKNIPNQMTIFALKIQGDFLFANLYTIKGISPVRTQYYKEVKRAGTTICCQYGK